MNFAFLSWKLIKEEEKILRAYNHNERQKEEYVSNPDIRREYTNQNYHLKNPEGPYLETIDTLIEKFHIKVRRSANLLIDGVISPSPEWIVEKSLQQQMEFFFRAYEYVKSRYTEKNILSAVVHMDENTPHMHFDVVPITLDNRLSACHFIPYPEGDLVEQNMFYEYMHFYYPEISRGLPKFMADKDHLAMKYFKVVPDYYDMSEVMWKAVNSIEGKGKELQEKKDWTMDLYFAISKMAAYTIVMQEGEVNYYKKKLIPYLLKELRAKNKQIEKLSKTGKEDSIQNKILEAVKDKNKERETATLQAVDGEIVSRKHIPLSSKDI